LGLPENEISATAVEERPIPFRSRRADAETLQERTAGRCEIEHGPSIPVETVRRLSCDASLLRVLENPHGEPLDVGRKTRSIPPNISPIS